MCVALCVRVFVRARACVCKTFLEILFFFFEGGEGGRGGRLVC